MLIKEIDFNNFKGVEDWREHLNFLSFIFIVIKEETGAIAMLKAEDFIVIFIIKSKLDSFMELKHHLILIYSGQMIFKQLWIVIIKASYFCLNLRFVRLE